MTKIKFLLLFVTIVITGCYNTKNNIDKLKIAETYYDALDKSNISEIRSLLTDSVLTEETEYNYKQVFSKEAYVEWLRWDSVFQPTYKVLKIEQEDGTVKAKISKTDIRISFLHNEPIVFEQVMRFNKRSISSIETTKYIRFNDSLFVKKRDTLVKWIDIHHPELNGFIYEQTKTGGTAYLKAITLFKTS